MLGALPQAAVNLPSHNSDKIGVGCLLQPMVGRLVSITDIVFKRWQGHPSRVICASLYPLRIRHISKLALPDHYG